MSAVGYVQHQFFVKVSTPLGADVLLVDDVAGEETLSGAGTFRLRLLSENSALSFEAIVGKEASLSIETPGGDKRYVHGVVGRFEQGETTGRTTTYFADLHPRIWLLTKTAGSRIFQNLSAPDIVKKVLAEHEITDVKDALTGVYPASEFCVQYQETAFDFISRLMEREGISYFFDHRSDGHTLVLADDASAFRAGPRLSAALPGAGWRRTDNVAGCLLGVQITEGGYKADDYNFQTPTTDLLATVTGQDAALSIYEYPAGAATKDVVEAIANRRLEALELPRRVLRATSNNPDLRPGTTVTVIDHPRQDANARYVVWKVRHEGSQADYSNAFEAFPYDRTFRPPRRTGPPRIPGCQTAVVVGPAGEEIATDPSGRVKVKFHWDQAARSDDTSSCWIRVSQAWAGKGFGAFCLPRIGQEVVVSFIDGDPDRPLVTGSVYNAVQTPPYALPDFQTRSVLKTQSTPGKSGFSEIRVDDKKDAEELFVRAQKAMNMLVLGDETHDNGANLTYTIKDDVALTIGGRLTLHVTGDLTLQISGNVSVKATGNIAQQASGTVSSESAQSISVKAGTSLSQEAGTTQNVEAGGILVIKGALVKIN
jgi:type VI secretion system secreted protein VgrG